MRFALEDIESIARAKQVQERLRMVAPNMRQIAFGLVDFLLPD